MTHSEILEIVATINSIGGEPSSYNECMDLAKHYEALGFPTIAQACVVLSTTDANHTDDVKRREGTLHLLRCGIAEANVRLEKAGLPKIANDYYATTSLRSPGHIFGTN